MFALYHRNPFCLEIMRGAFIRADFFVFEPAAQRSSRRSSLACYSTTRQYLVLKYYNLKKIKHII